MLAYFLFILLLLMFVCFFYILGKEWYAPYTLYSVPFLLITIIGANNQNLWGFRVNPDTFIAFFLNILFFSIGCVICKGIKRKKHYLLVQKQRISIKNKKLIILFAIIFITFVYYYYILNSWGKSHGMNVMEAINYVMIMSKFNTGVETIHKPIVFKFLILYVEILPYILSYWIARRVLLKEEVSLKWLIVCYISCLACLFLNGSRGPLVECFVGLGIAFGIVYYQKKRKKTFSFKMILPIVISISLLIVAFFAILPYMGRTQTADTLIDSVYQYIGSQIHNFNYWVSGNVVHSSGFFANTFSALYDDLNTFFGIDLSNMNKTITLFFVTSSTGHNMGNVFTCLFSYYADAGLIGIVLFAFISGFISEKSFLNIKGDAKLIDVSFPVYLYIATNLFFSFFGSRFYTNVINIRFIVKMIYIVLIYMYTTNSRISRKNFRL